MISAILLAAGQSKRMNGENKLTKKINGVPLINRSILNILESSIEELIIVTGYQNEILESIINNHEGDELVSLANKKLQYIHSLEDEKMKVKIESNQYFLI